MYSTRAMVWPLRGFLTRGFTLVFNVEIEISMESGFRKLINQCWPTLRIDSIEALPDITLNKRRSRWSSTRSIRKSTLGSFSHQYPYHSQTLTHIKNGGVQRRPWEASISPCWLLGYMERALSIDKSRHRKVRSKYSGFGIYRLAWRNWQTLWFIEILISLLLQIRHWCG